MKPFEQQTYYELLEIPVTAPEAEIREAYERALETYSPDSVAVYTLVDPGQVDALRARLTEAMEILTEPDLRAEYDRMIGVSRGDAGAVVTLAPALAAAAQSVQPQESTPAASKAAPAPIAASAAPEPTLAPPEPAPAPTAAAAEPPSVPTAAVPAPPAPLVMPGVVTPSQIHAAFRSYAISYVPVLVPAPSLTGSAFLSPFAPPAQAGTPQSGSGPEASGDVKVSELVAPSTPSAAPAAPEAVAAQSPAPSAEPVQPPVSTPPSVAEATPRSTSAAEQGSTSSVPATPAAAEAPQPMAAQADSEPARPLEPAPEPAAPEQSAPVVVHHEEEDELSGARAPPPAPGEARAASAKPGRPTPSSRPERPVRPTYTPPPLPPGSRRTTRATPAVQSGSPAAEAGKGTARSGQSSGMDLEEAQQIAQESAIATAEAALAQVAAKAREPRPKPIDLPPNAEFNGEVLRQVRESRGLTLQQVAERTRISAKHLENVEADRYAALPATVYLRGIIMNLARELGLDPLKVSRSYLALATGPKNK